MLLYVSGVNYNVNSNYTKYSAQFCCRLFAFWKNLVAPPTNGTTKRLERCKEHQILQ